MQTIIFYDASASAGVLEGYVHKHERYRGKKGFKKLT
jgi:hypothetical protein